MGFYDDEFIEFAKELILENDFMVLVNGFYTNLINEKYPFFESRIDFSKLRNSRFYRIDGVIISDYIKKIIEENNLNIEEDIIYVGDSSTENEYKFKLKYLIKILSNIMEIPQHHYFISEKEKWCLYIAFEDYLEFGLLE